MTHTNSTTQKGTSLLETAVYIAIFSVIAVVVVSTMLSLSRSYISLRVTQNINNATMVAFEQMVRNVRLAESVDVANSTLGIHPGRLTVVVDTTTVEFYLNGTTLRMRKGGVDVGLLTTPDVSVTSLIFRRVTNGNSEGVKIDMTIQSTLGKITKTENVYDFVVLRDSY